MSVPHSPSRKAIVARVMGAFKEGALDKRDGESVTDRRQAIAIALHEAGASDREGPETNRHSLQQTKARERAARTKQGAPPTRADLYDEARRRRIRGRSSMSKAALAKALRD